MPAKSMRLQFPYRGLSEYDSVSDQPGETSADIQNMLAVDPVEGRKRGGQRPGTKKYVSPQINDDASIQDINHITGPNLESAAGEGQIIGAEPETAPWTLIDKDGAANPGSGGGSPIIYQSSCWDACGNVYIATRATTTSTSVVLTKYNLSQASQWTVTVAHGSSSSSIPPVAGMVVIGTRLFIFWDGAGAEQNDAHWTSDLVERVLSTEGFGKYPDAFMDKHGDRLGKGLVQYA